MEAIQSFDLSYAILFRDTVDQFNHPTARRIQIRVYLLQQNKDIYEESLRVAACGIPPIIQEEGGIVDRREFEASFRYAPFGFKFLSTATHFGCFPTALLLTIPELPSVDGHLWSTKFPFCIPFDIINMINGFQSSAEAPCFEFLVIPENSFGLDIEDQYIAIDFSDQNLNIFIQILRFFLSAAFVIWLIVLTRKVIGAE